MFNDLTNNLKKIVNKIRFYDDEQSLQKALSELKKSLLKSDVHHKVTKELLLDVEERTKKIGIGKDNFLISLKSTLENILTVNGSIKTFVFAPRPPTIILMVGLQGSGKTTTSGKLAYFLKQEKKKKVLLIALDLKRLGAVEQLEQIASDIEVQIVSNKNAKNHTDLIQDGLKKAKENLYDVVILDTAGRLAIDDELMNELENIKKLSNPNETFYVADSMSGADATKTASIFNDRINLSGIILSKFDSDSKGGIAISISYQIKIPLLFIGTGEKMTDLEQFIPRRIVSRLMGEGDLESLTQKIASNISDREIQNISKKIKKGALNFNDFINQLESMKKIGSMKSILSMLPNMGNLSKNIENIDLETSPEIIKIKAMVGSMTEKERIDTLLVKNKSRRMRISKGAGISIEECNRFIKQFKNSSKLIKSFSNKNKMSKIEDMLKNYQQ